MIVQGQELSLHIRRVKSSSENFGGKTITFELLNHSHQRKSSFVSTCASFSHLIPLQSLILSPSFSLLFPLPSCYIATLADESCKLTVSYSSLVDNANGWLGDGALFLEIHIEPEDMITCKKNHRLSN